MGRRRRGNVPSLQLARIPSSRPRSELAVTPRANGGVSIAQGPVYVLVGPKEIEPLVDAMKNCQASAVPVTFRLVANCNCKAGANEPGEREPYLHEVSGHGRIGGTPPGERSRDRGSHLLQPMTAGRKTTTFVGVLVICMIASAPVATGDPSYEAMADNAFIKILAEDAMMIQPYDVGDLITSGRGVCHWVDSGASSGDVDNYVHAVNQNKTDLWVARFEAISIRTFCPPTPEQRSW